MKAIRTILACIRKADNKYNLINHGDKIVVGLSGGIDSVTLLYALHLYQKFSHTEFTVQPVILDLGFDGFNPDKMIEFCHSLGYELIVSDSKEVYPILKAHQEDDKHLPCSICSRMKKAAINKVANDLGFNKVAFAHHADDAIETLFMNEIYGARIASFTPKMHLEKADITFIRPLVLCRENEIKKLVREENLPVLDSKCPADKTTTREDIKNLLNEIYKKYPSSKENFLTMLDNYKKNELWDEELYYHVSQDNLTLKPVLHKNDEIIVRDIRVKCYIEEQNCPIWEEFETEKDLESNEFLICLNEKPIGTIRYREMSDGFKIERFAVLKEYRGHDYGKQAFKYLCDEIIAARNNPCRVYMHAQKGLLDYYRSLGFTPKGEEFIEANIVHIEMEKFY
ncbi:MAG: GNAT family N-acetyltransferase [Bacilli bacterium]|nr:GNAT family N-acetyltransferase [Bacilli bacterium]